ncbi:20009_t:CDS:2 [Cetraspora pellucida]|uniref:20009_t:CDS:1 n=1 Tax=Cetraspora pellucida TaxID=1433469 RepID=A0A9N9I3F2_9GLOM|nr:20009_t:CDS:2 [Cetraspora pellucida]
MAFSFAAKFSINFVAKELSTPTTILWTNSSTNLFLTSQSTMAHSSSYTAKKVIEKKKIYTETIRIICKAINIAIEINDPNVLRFLKEYITKKRHSLVENTTSISYFDQKANMFNEYFKYDIIEASFTRVSNPIKKVRKGRSPKTTCNQSLLERQPLRNKGKQSELTCSYKTNTCSKCGSKDYNH